MRFFKKSTSQSRTFSANANSVANIAKPKNIAAHPGPGVTSMTIPAPTIANPIINTRGFLIVAGTRYQPFFSGAM